jgi:hypothetical protein
VQSPVTLAITIAMGLTLGVSLFSLLLPTPATQSSAALFHFRLFISPLIPALHIIAAILFMKGLEGFRKELYKPYRLIALSIIIIGFSMLLSPMVAFFDLWESALMQVGYVTIPYSVALIIMYGGLRGLSGIIGMRSVWQSVVACSIGIVAGLLVITFLPHGAVASSEIMLDVRNGFFALTSFLSFIAAMSAFAISRRIAPAYAKALVWLGVGLVTQTVLVFSSIFFALLNIDPRKFASLQDLLTLTGVPFVAAGYFFYQLTADTRRAGKPMRPASVIDVVLYVASLSSNRKAIDPILDDVRILTSRLQPGQALSDADKAALGTTYLKLERHLTTQEVLRSFTRDGLRRLVYGRFIADTVADGAFWNALPPPPESVASPVPDIRVQY